MERRGRQLWRLLQFCNEHKKWEHIRYYPALVNLSSTSYGTENLEIAVNVSRRVYVGRIVINFHKVLLMGRLRSNLIILSLSPLHRLYGLLLAGICNPLPDWLVLALCSSLNHFNHHMKTPYFEHMKYESTLYWQFCFYILKVDKKSWHCIGKDKKLMGGCNELMMILNLRPRLRPAAHSVCLCSLVLAALWCEQMPLMDYLQSTKNIINQELHFYSLKRENNNHCV